MRQLIITLAIILLSVTAQAQTIYDPRSGNSYNVQQNLDGSTQVRGNNLNTGSQWNQTTQPNGNMRGTDSHYNSWNYNAQSGQYTNSNGHGCTGKGYARMCY